MTCRVRTRRLAAALFILSAAALPAAALAVPAPATAAASPSVTVAENQPQHAVPARYGGFSIEPGNLCYVVSLAQSDPAFLQLFTNLGPGVLRVGGDTGDTTASWSAAGPASCAWNDVVITPALVNSFFAFAQEIGYQVMWQVPLNNQAAAQDAAEAAYVATMPNVASIEIGNEPNAYPGATTGYQSYISDWDAVYADYREDGGTAPVTGPAASFPASFYVNPFLSQDSADISALTQHFYAGSATTKPTCASLITMRGARSVAVSGTATASSYGLPFIINETNTYKHYGMPGVSNAYCSALWAADYLMIGLAAGVQGVYFHGTADDPSGNSAGVAQYYTPINYGGTPAPEYYGMLFARQVTQAGGNQVQVSDTNAAGLDAFAVLGGDGDLRVALVNRSAAVMTVSVTTADSYASASQETLTAPSLGSLSGVTLGGASVASDGTFTPSPQPVSVNGTISAVTVPADSATVVTYTPAPPA